MSAWTREPPRWFPRAVPLHPSLNPVNQGVHRAAGVGDQADAARDGVRRAFETLDETLAGARHLVARTQSGPFEPRTYRLDTYLGIRRSGALVAMAGKFYGARPA